MANANQIIVNGKTILDLRSDTITPETLQKGYTAHDKSGTKITGTLEASSVSVQDTKAVTITSNGTVSVTPDAPYDALKKVDVTVNVASGGGGGAGFSVTFPATATAWNRVRNAVLLLSDGAVKSFSSYSDVSGKTIENVACILLSSYDPFFVLRMTLSNGMIAQISNYSLGNKYITTAPNTTPTPYNAGTNTVWWPIADTVISAIEMYNTD